MRRSFITTTALAAVVGLAACSSEIGATPTHRSDVEYAPASLTHATAAPDVVERCVEMGLDIVAAAEENAVFSPVSWCMALGMVAPGTTNDGRTDMEAAVGTDVEAFVEALGAIAATLAEADGDPAELEDLGEAARVHRANQVVVHEGVEPNADYLDTLRKHFDAGLDETDLTTDDGLEPLHEFVQEHTGGRIERSAIQPNDALRLVLQDAIFFASPWVGDLHQLPEDDFTNADGSTAQVAYVGANAHMPYAEVDGWQAGRLGLYDGYAAVFFLPPEGGGTLDLDTRQALLDALDSRQVDFAVPELDLASTTDLRDWFGHFGMGSLVEAEGDPLGDIIEGEQLVIGQAMQQATLELDEDGVVATAVTEIGVGATSAEPDEPVELRLDRPFTMAIMHRDLGLDLFQATVRTMGE